MTNPLEPVRMAFDKAVGPHRKRHNLIVQLKESDVGKDRRAAMVKEAAELETEWVNDLMALWKAMEESEVLRAKKES